MRQMSALDPVRKSARGMASRRIQFRPSTRCQISDVHPADRMPLRSMPWVRSDEVDLAARNTDIH